MRLFMLAVLLSLLVACVPRTRSDAAVSLLCPEVGTVETRKPALVSMFIKVKTCAGEAVTNLSISDFVILEDDEAISNLESQPDIFPSEQTFRPITVLLLDLSASIVKAGALPELKEAAKRFVETLSNSEEQAHLALFWFDGSAEISQLNHFDATQRELLQAIDSLSEDTPKDDSTNLNGAIISGLTVLENEKLRLQSEGIGFTLSSLVLFTDGTDRASRVSESIALQAVRSQQDNTLIQTLALGSEINELSLRTIGKDGFEYAQNTDEIAAAFERAAERIRKETQSFYLVRYCSPRRAGMHQLGVTIRYNGMTGSFRQNFSADGFEAGCDATEEVGDLLAQRVPDVSQADVQEGNELTQTQTQPRTNNTPRTTNSIATEDVNGLFDVVCLKNETPWEISYANKWGENETYYEAKLQPNASNVHPWPLSAKNPSPKFIVRFDQDFSTTLEYKEYSLSKQQSRQQTCVTGKQYVFRRLPGEQKINLYALE